MSSWKTNSDKLEAAQAQMKAVNVYYRKHKTFDGCPDLTEKERRQIEDDWARGWYVGIPYPPYTLSNNNANIKRIRQRIEGLKREKSRQSTEQEIECGSLDVTVKENVEEMRLQLFFEDKLEVRDLLKAEAFKWSPRNGCWQRQLTDNARSATRRVLKKLQEFPENKEVNEYGN